MSAVVAAARGWLGTPYVHQGRCKGAGADCLGLVLGVWDEVLGRAPSAVPAYGADWAETGAGDPLWEAARAHLIPLPPGVHQPGSVLLFRMREHAQAKHLGLASGSVEQPHFIHAYTGRGVVESALTAPWARRVVARFAFPTDV